MRIVQQLAVVFYSPFPALPAPRVAGLLPASIPPRIESHQLLIDFQPSTPREALLELEPIRSIEEMDAEIAPLVFAVMESTFRLHQCRAERSRRQ